MKNIDFRRAPNFDIIYNPNIPIWPKYIETITEDSETGRIKHDVRCYIRVGDWLVPMSEAFYYFNLRPNEENVRRSENRLTFESRCEKLQKEYVVTSIHIKNKLVVKDESIV